MKLFLWIARDLHKTLKKSRVKRTKKIMEKRINEFMYYEFK